MEKIIKNIFRKNPKDHIGNELMRRQDAEMPFSKLNSNREIKAFLKRIDTVTLSKWYQILEAESPSIIIGTDDRYSVAEISSVCCNTRSIGILVKKSTREKNEDERLHFYQKTPFADYLKKQYAKDYPNAQLHPNLRFKDENVLAGALGTAFIIGENKLLTCKHCVENITEEEVHVVFGYENPNQISGFLASDVYACKKITRFEDIDLAIIETTEPIMGRDALKLASKFSPKENYRLYALGFPEGLAMKIAMNGTTKDFYEKSSGFKSDLDLNNVNSGSPVFDIESGEVIGIATGLLTYYIVNNDLVIIEKNWEKSAPLWCISIVKNYSLIKQSLIV